MKGRVLLSPKGLKIRPTSDQVRGAIFNIIGQDLSGLRVLDLFAGTGSLGFEALSRGALFSLFVDNSQQSVNLIKKNLSLCGCCGLGTVLRADLNKGIPRNHPLLKEPFDLVFLDPPYGKGYIPSLLEEISTGKILSSVSRVVAESSKSERLPVSMGSLEMSNSKLFGDTRITLYTYEKKR
jgi:16S rRNA (guanine966-N2)-methyltransferase